MGLKGLPPPWGPERVVGWNRKRKAAQLIQSQPHCSLNLGAPGLLCDVAGGPGSVIFRLPRSWSFSSHEEHNTQNQLEEALRIELLAERPK